MQVIRDNETSGLAMIPLFSQHVIARCNIKGCKGKPTTLCLHDKATFALCENHYNYCIEKGEVNKTVRIRLAKKNIEFLFTLIYIYIG